MQIHEARPPFVEFKRIAVDDRARSEELGYRVTKDVDMAFIMQPGSKDQVERVAVDWLAMLKRKAMDRAPDAYPQAWIDALHAKFDAWKAGHDAPLNGTSVKEWPVLSPAQAENFIGIGVLCIEDVASMTEEAMGRFGLGGRGLRDKAREWLEGKDAAKVIAAENADLKQQVAEMQAQLKQLLAAENVTPIRRGRKSAQG
jgi:hypothetical protein